MNASTFRFSVFLPQRLRSERLARESLPREAFYEWAWAELAPFGLQGIHEGTVLADEAFDRGLETESWTVDSGEAPRERDWIAGQQEEEAELYFGDRAEAGRARAYILETWSSLQISGLEEVPAQDWDAEWKASFQGFAIAPHWRVCPPWNDLPGEGRMLRINPGAGFGTGTHETTQLCLGFIAETAAARGGNLAGLRALDFGSGSGILAIGVALLGASVLGVEIDPLAVDNARENLTLNPGTEKNVRFELNLDAARPEDRQPESFDLVIANILKPVLLQFSEVLTRAVKMKAGAIILSGLIERDVEEVRARYLALLPAGTRCEVRAQGDWRALRFI